MKTFEERYTAWVDGALAGEEREAFEREYPMLASEKEDVDKLRGLLKGHLQAPVLTNPDFFNSQLLQAIKNETVTAAAGSRRARWWGLPRLAWAGLGSALAAAAVLLTVAIHPAAKQGDYVAEVLKAQTNDPAVKATVDSKKDVTIIKLDGLEKLPAEKELKP